MTAAFSRTARSERHFSALLLPHLLMSNNFAGCRALFKKLELLSGEECRPDDVEIVAELNPIRDVAARADEFEEAPLVRQGQVVPDLFLRVGNSALVIEAKFFTYPSASKIAGQLKKQRDAIETVLRHPKCAKYADCTFRYLALTVDQPNGRAEWGEDMSRMTWREVISVLKPVVDAGGSWDTAYALEQLKDAVERSTAERRSPRENGRCASIDELLRQAPALLDDGNLYIGFTGGEKALADVTIDDMEKRDHYKYSDRNPNKNWIPLHLVISHYLELLHKGR